MRRPALFGVDPEELEGPWGAPERPTLWSRFLNTILRALIGAAIVAGVTVVLFVFAILVFLLMRGVLIPKAIHEETVYFDFAPEGPEPYVKPFASVNLLSSRKQWDATNFTTLTPGEPPPRALTLLQHYTVEVSMLLSRSPRNYEIGKFMLYSRLHDSSGHLLAKSSRPIVVPYRSSLSETIEIFFSWPLILIGAHQETNQVSVELFNNYQESRLHPVAQVDMFLSRSDPDIERVTLSLLPQLRGLQHLFYRYRLLSSLVFIGGVFLLEVAVVLAIIGSRVVTQLFADRRDEEAPEMGEPVIGTREPARRTFAAEESESEEASSSYDITPMSGDQAFIMSPSTSLHETGLRRRRPLVESSSEHSVEDESEGKGD